MSEDGSRSGGADQVALYEVCILQSVTQLLFEQVLEVFLTGPLEDWPGRVANGLAYVCRQSPSGFKMLPEMALRILEVAEQGAQEGCRVFSPQCCASTMPHHSKAPKQPFNQKHARII